MRELVNLETITPFDRLTLAMVGTEGGGKSFTAASGRPNIWFFDFDKRLKALGGKPGVFGATYYDPNDGRRQPEGFNEALADLTKLEAKRSLQHMGIVAARTDVIKTVVVDSIQTIAKAARDYILYSTGDVTRTINIPQMPVRVIKSFDGWNAEMSTVEQFVLRLLAIPDIDVIITLHETFQKDVLTSTPENIRRTSRIDVFPERYRLLLKYFNEVWRIKRLGPGAPTIQLDPDPAFTSKSVFLRAEIGEDVVKSANINNMIAAYLKKHPTINATATKQLTA